MPRGMPMALTHSPYFRCLVWVLITREGTPAVVGRSDWPMGGHCARLVLVSGPGPSVGGPGWGGGGMDGENTSVTLTK